MANDIKLQSSSGKHPVDENLRPILVGKKRTSIETAQHGDGARVNGDLIVTGKIEGKTDIQLTDDITCDDITCGTLTASATISGSDFLTTHITSTDLTINDAGTIILDSNDGVIKFQLAGDADDLCTLTVTANGATTLATADSDGSAGHLTLDINGDINIEPDGHVEFDGCGVGFDKETTTFAAAAVTSEGDDSTDIDFRLGNKHELTLTDDISGSSEYINMIFPATSGNFILVLIQGVADCTVASAGWRAYASDETLCDNLAGTDLTDGRVRWAGGTAPTLSTSQYDIDIISIYWDADNQTAFAVASLDF